MEFQGLGVLLGGWSGKISPQKKNLLNGPQLEL